VATSVAQLVPRTGTAAAWVSSNPVLAASEIGRETDTGRWKFGDGVTVWTSLPYEAKELVVVQVVADGVTDVSGQIQAVLTSLVGAHSRSYRVVVEPAFPYSGGRIYLNGKVRIQTSTTVVSFATDVLLGPLCDPDGFGCLSIIGASSGTTTITSGAVRGNAAPVVAATTGIAAGGLVWIYDTDTAGNAASGSKQEVAEVVEVAGTTVYLDHPLHHTYSGTVTMAYLAPITNSGFENVHAAFTGQQAAGFLFPVKLQWTRDCFLTNVMLKGKLGNSWSREGFNVRASYRTQYDNCTAVYPWNNAVGSTYSYGFSADGSTDVKYTSCRANNMRHGFTADKGAANISYSQCSAMNVLASGFDIHGAWARDIIYTGCNASSAPDVRSANDGFRAGFLAGNTTYTVGVTNVQYEGCTSRGFAPYTRAGAFGNGDGAGFGVVDGCSNIRYSGCTVLDSEIGWYVLSEVGQPITNVLITGSAVHNLVSSDPTTRPALPLYVKAGAAPNDVDGLTVDGFTVMNSPTAGSMRIYGTSTNQLANITLKNCTWTNSLGASGVYSVDARYVDKLVITGCDFLSTRRGITTLNCPGAEIYRNAFINLTEPGRFWNDSGGNTNIRISDNRFSPAPTALTTAVTSTGVFVEFPAVTAVATANLPTYPASAVGAYSGFDSTVGKPKWWDGTAHVTW